MNPDPTLRSDTSGTPDTVGGPNGHSAADSADDPPKRVIEGLKRLTNPPTSPARPNRHPRTRIEDERRVSHRYFTIAATAAIALLLGAAVTWSHHKSYRLPLTMLELVLTEPNLFDKTYTANPQVLAAGLARVGLGSTAHHPVVEVRRATVPGGEGTHLVVDTPYGRAVLTLMPNQSVRGERRVVRRGLIAVVRPDGQGSYSIVAESDRAIDAAEDILRERPMRRI